MRLATALACALALSAFSATVARGDTWNNETDVAAELDYVNLQFPASFTVSASTSTPTIYGRVYEAGVTEPAGPAASITSQIGYGPGGSNPTTSGGWTWSGASFNIQLGNDEEYQASFTAPAFNGTYAYTYRFSIDGGTTWTAADLNGAGSNAGLTFEPSQLGVMTVIDGLVPEPSACGLLALGALALLRRRTA